MIHDAASDWSNVCIFQSNLELVRRMLVIERSEPQFGRLNGAKRIYFHLEHFLLSDDFLFGAENFGKYCLKHFFINYIKRGPTPNINFSVKKSNIYV